MTPRVKTLLAGMALGLSFSTTPLDAKEWSGTIGEPLRDSSEQALQLVDHLRSIGARFFGAWTCPACFRQMNLCRGTLIAKTNHLSLQGSCSEHQTFNAECIEQLMRQHNTDHGGVTELIE